MKTGETDKRNGRKEERKESETETEMPNGQNLQHRELCLL